MGKLNDQLRALVKGRSVKISELADRLQISRSYLSVLLNQDKIPSDDLIERLGAELKLPQDQLNQLLIVASEERSLQEEIRDPSALLKARLGERSEPAQLGGGGLESVSFSPCGVIRETCPSFQARWKTESQTDWESLESAELLLMDDWGEILLQETITPIHHDGDFLSFEFALPKQLGELKRGLQYRWQTYLNYCEKSGRLKRRYLAEVTFEVISPEDELQIFHIEKACRKRIVYEFLQFNLFADAIAEVEEIKKMSDQLKALGEELSEEEEELSEQLRQLALRYPYN